MQVLFWGSFLILVYIYIGYFAVIFGLSKIFSKRVAHKQNFLPTVSLIIPVKNEEMTLREKLENTLQLDYPKQLLQIIVIDSSSEDATQSIVKEFETQGVELVIVPHKGKAYAMKKAIDHHCKGEIIISTDANAYFETDVVKKVVQHFADEQVGAVTGAMLQLDKSGTGASKGGDFYWKMEKFLRIHESRFHSCISLSGEISVFRRDILKNQEWYVHGDPDDFDITLFMVQKGKRVIYEDEAFVFEKAPDTKQDVFTQKSRIIVQTISALVHHPMIFFVGRYGFIIFSRKLLPLLSPIFLIIMFLSCIFLFENVFYFSVFCIQILFYSLFLLNVEYSFLRVTNFVVLLNWIIFQSYFLYFQGRDYTKWDKILSSRK